MYVLIDLLESDSSIGEQFSFFLANFDSLPYMKSIGYSLVNIGPMVWGKIIQMSVIYVPLFIITSL